MLTARETIAVILAGYFACVAAAIAILHAATRRRPDARPCPAGDDDDGDCCLLCGAPCGGISARYCDACMDVPALFRD